MMSHMTDVCKKCAECCKHYPFVELSDDEVISLQKSTGMQADGFTNRKGAEFKEYFLKFQNNGYCLFLNEKDGIFSCDVYGSRPQICRNFPSKHPQQEVCDTNIRIIGGLALSDICL